MSDVLRSATGTSSFVPVASGVVLTWRRRLTNKQEFRPNRYVQVVTPADDVRVIYQPEGADEGADE